MRRVADRISYQYSRYRSGRTWSPSALCPWLRHLLGFWRFDEDARHQLDSCFLLRHLAADLQHSQVHHVASCRWTPLPAWSTPPPGPLPSEVWPVDSAASPPPLVKHCGAYVLPFVGTGLPRSTRSGAGVHQQRHSLSGGRWVASARTVVESDSKNSGRYYHMSWNYAFLHF